MPSNTTNPLISSILWTTVVEAPRLTPLGIDSGMYWIFNLLLGALQVLHVLWTFMFLNIVLEKFRDGKVSGLRNVACLRDVHYLIRDENERWARSVVVIFNICYCFYTWSQGIHS